MESDNEAILKEFPKVNIENTINNKPVKKQKGWGHWSSYLKSDEYLQLIPGTEDITEEELSKHNKPGDLWIGLAYEKRVCVFDVTLFAEYHPGGYEIIKSVAGRDATEDFRIAHAYVNPNMIARFKKGYLVRSAFKSPNSLSPFASMLPPVRKPQAVHKPKWDWSESGDIVTLTFSLHKIIVQKLNCVSVLCPSKEILKLRIFFDENYYFFEIKLNDYLSPLIDSLQCDRQGKSLSISLKSSLGFPVSNLGGVVVDAILSLTDSVSKEEFLPCTVVKTRDLNYDCREFTIAWPEWAHVGIPLGHHVIIQSMIESETVQRPYTPVCEITPNLEKSIFSRNFTLMVKRYSDGIFSSYLHLLDDDCTIMVSLATGTFKSPSWVGIETPVMKTPKIEDMKSVVLLAAGSGITPMIRIIMSCLFADKFICHLLFFNKQQRDIIYTNEFEALEEHYNKRFNVTNILSQPHQPWTGAHGRISESIIRTILMDKFTDRFYMICGPLGFNNLAVEILRSLNVDNNQIFQFKG